jgi:type I restriction enzyme R subunit
VTRTVIDSAGNETETQDSEDGTLRLERDIEPHPGQEETQGDDERKIRELPRKYYLDGVAVYIIGEQAFELDTEENVLRTVQFTDYVAEHVRRLCPDAAYLRSLWPLADQRLEILSQLEQRGIDPKHLAQVTHQENADPLDLLLHVAFQAPLVSRKERLEKLHQKKANFFNIFTPAARQILDELLDKYADFGIEQFNDLGALLEVPPFDAYGGPVEIVNLFGGPKKFKETVNTIEKMLYEE